ncbi:hypothetical protein CFOL_v3_33531 [Cephalotus follicularis]|uniref:Uncharacterized protein n=1 Tax=Cephalotus follicularis TaxID=3775 RepID=A0A1Q3DCD5_CEPFO|nr:hypothetical protein CFOL_v3_33531 [Cephalotus follicularis]
MKTTSKYTRSDSTSLWNWNGNNKKKRKDGNWFPVAEFLGETRQKMEAIVDGPGGGIGIGCGFGVGFGMVGGIGFGGHVKPVFGVGLGCGVGVGFGYGQGIGYGFSIKSLESYFFEQRPDSKKRPLIEKVRIKFMNII